MEMVAAPGPVRAGTRRYLTMTLEIFERLGILIEPDKRKKELADLPETR